MLWAALDDLRVGRSGGPRRSTNCLRKLDIPPMSLKGRTWGRTFQADPGTKGTDAISSPCHLVWRRQEDASHFTLLLPKAWLNILTICTMVCCHNKYAPVPLGPHVFQQLMPACPLRNRISLRWRLLHLTLAAWEKFGSLSPCVKGKLCYPMTLAHGAFNFLLWIASFHCEASPNVSVIFQMCYVIVSRDSSCEQYSLM